MAMDVATRSVGKSDTGCKWMHSRRRAG